MCGGIIFLWFYPLFQMSRNFFGLAITFWALFLLRYTCIRGKLVSLNCVISKDEASTEFYILSELVLQTMPRDIFIFNCLFNSLAFTNKKKRVSRIPSIPKEFFFVLNFFMSLINILIINFVINIFSIIVTKYINYFKKFEDSIFTFILKIK